MATPGGVVRADEPIVAALQGIWIHELNHLEQQIPGVIEGRDDECLHQLRVSLRRSRALLKVLDKVLPPHVQLATELKWLAQATGPLRDLDVHYADFKAWLGPAWSGPGLSVLEAIQLRRGQARLELAELLRDVRCRELLCDWRRFLGFLPNNPSHRIATAVAVVPLLPRRVKKLSRRLCQRGREIGPHSPDAQLHQMRIRGKRLRYLLENFEPVFARRRCLHELVRALKDLQDVLGQHQDCVAARAAFRALADEPGVGAGALFELGRWDRELELRQSRARAAFPARFEAFARACRKRPWRM